MLDIARVTTRGGSFTYAARAPLATPTTSPMPSATRMAIQRFSFLPSMIAAVMTAVIVAAYPTDRSRPLPPPAMTIIWHRPNSEMKEASLTVSRTWPRLRKLETTSWPSTKRNTMRRRATISFLNRS